MAAKYTGYYNDAYCNQYDDHNAETREQFDNLFQCYNETFVDDESYRSFSAPYTADGVYVCESAVAAPIHLRGNVQEAKTYSRESTPNTTPKKPSCRRERSHSAPGRRSTTAIYDPSTVQRRQDAAPALRRSRSTVFHRPGEETVQRRNDMESQFTMKPATLNQSSYEFYPAQRTRYVRRSDSERRLLPVTPHTYVDVNSNRSGPRYCDISETSLVSRRPTTSNKKSATNLAVIPPNHRTSNQSEAPLLAKSPDKFEAAQRHSPAKASWVHLPTQPVATESLWLSGVVLLVTGIASCVLCFYILSKVSVNFLFIQNESACAPH